MSALVEIGHAASHRGAPPPLLAAIGIDDSSTLLSVASDLGLPAVEEIAPLLAMVALTNAGLETPWQLGTRGLSAVDRARLGPAVGGDGTPVARLVAVDDGQLGVVIDGTGPTRAVGEARDVARAIAALREAKHDRRTVAYPEDVHPSAVLDIIFGPPRPLSDPASKSALRPYGIPVPTEELCSSPSRAAAEATRIGFPVSLALASPDLRIWDHPDLAVDGIDNAARVREVFRQMMSLARERSSDARLLGVIVTATTASRALLRVAAAPLPHHLVLAEVGFADPHGVASGDRTKVVLPALPERVEQVLRRLAGAPLLFEGTPTQRRASVTALADVLNRVARFVDDRRREVDSVEIDPLALLLDGTVEVREACVTVNDAFARTLDSAP
jgi:hypothetical protein